MVAGYGRRVRHGPRPLVVLAIAGALALSACGVDPGVVAVQSDRATGEPGAGPDDPDAPGSPYDGTVEWRACEESIPLGPRLDCGSIEVPLDHADPAGDSIEIALVRSAATGDDRIGSLLFNPGGPGGSGIEFLTSAVLVVPAELQERFDLVSFDPRGVGASTAVDCDIDFDDNVPVLEQGDDAGWQALVDEAETAMSRCTGRTAQIAPYLGTNSAARDLDLIRAALGDDRLSYVGFSYGTRLGATYAELFPDRVRALVLDGAVKPTSDLSEIAMGQAPAFDAAFESFLDACEGDRDCAMYDADRTTLVAYTNLVAWVATLGSIPAGERDLTPGELELAVIAGMYSTELWPVLATGLHEADQDSDGTVLQALADSYLGRLPDGTYSSSQAAGALINCADDPGRPPTDEVREQAEAVAAQSVWFDGTLRASTGCIGTPDPIDPLVIGPADGAPPLLVIGTTGDPATPYEWAIEMADMLSSAVLYTVEGEGHTAFLGEPCVEDVVVRYLVDLEVPGEGSSCTSDAVDDVFLPPGESEIDQALALFACLREEGLDIPELTLGDVLADPSGGELLDALDPTDPAFLEAVFACQHLIPT